MITTDIRNNDKEIELLKRFIGQTLNYAKRDEMTFSDIPYGVVCFSIGYHVCAFTDLIEYKNSFGTKYIDYISSKQF